jgi:transposase InsO family protein
MPDTSPTNLSPLARGGGRMLREISKVEQRYDAVLAVIRDGMAVTEIAEKFGVARQTVHVWLARYEAGGLEALSDRSHKPHSSPLQIAPEIETRALELRRMRPTWGPARLRHELKRQGVVPLPSLSALYRCLVRHHLIEEKAKRKRLPTYKRWERGRPMELWQMDVVGGIVLEDGTDCKVLTGIDDHSRFCVCAGIMQRATGRPVCGFFLQALERHGVPEEVLTDNGKVFTNRFGIKPTEVLFDKLCRENGIIHRLTAPASPTTTGKIERFHRTLRQEFIKGRVFSSLCSAQEELDAFVLDYNTNRPHQSLKMATPAERFLNNRVEHAPVVALDRRAFDEDRSGEDWISRFVSKNGTISVQNQLLNVGMHRGGFFVDVHVNEHTLEVWQEKELLKTVLRTSKGVVRKKQAEQHQKN